MRERLIVAATKEANAEIKKYNEDKIKGDA